MCSTSVDELIDGLSGEAEDLKRSYSALVRQNTELTAQQLWGTLTASALAAQSATLTEPVLDEAARHLSPQALEAVKSTAAVAGASSAYYRFEQLPSGGKPVSRPPKPRISLLRRRTVSAVDVELWSIAVSTVDGCAKCIAEHERAARAKGVSEEAILAVVRIASVLHAIGGVMNAERGAVSARHFRV